MTRRGFTAGLAISLFLASCAPSGPQSEVKLAPDTPHDPIFIGLSRALTGYSDLDPDLADRISEAFGRLFPDLKAQFGKLDELAVMNPDPEHMLIAATEAGVGEAALAIVAAWYTGTVGTGSMAAALAYADALMNRPVADALRPPTYQFGGPGWWTAGPPPVGIAAPSRNPTPQALSVKAEKA